MKIEHHYIKQSIDSLNIMNYYKENNTDNEFCGASNIYDQDWL